MRAPFADRRNKYPTIRKRTIWDAISIESPEYYDFIQKVGRRLLRCGGVNLPPWRRRQRVHVNRAPIVPGKGRPGIAVMSEVVVEVDRRRHDGGGGQHLTRFERFHTDARRRYIRG